MGITLDLMELDGKATPDALVSEIFRQNPDAALPVRVEEIASAAGIVEIKPLTSDGFEGMLISNPEKSEGVIFVQQDRPPQRRRFTIGHEVGHFLLPWHKNVANGSLKFECTAEHMRAQGAVTGNSRADWEIQANEFSSELLMPRPIFKKYMKRKNEPDLEHVLDLSGLFDTSVEATARRYVALSDFPIAMVFVQGQQVRHAWRGPEFPYFLDARKGTKIPRESQSYSDGPDDSVADFEAIDSHWWLDIDRGSRPPTKILEQTLYQQKGYRIVLLYADGELGED